MVLEAIMLNRYIIPAFSGRSKILTCTTAASTQRSAIGAIRPVKADEKGFELLSFSLTSATRLSLSQSSIFCWPGETRTHNFPVKSRILCHLSYEPFCDEWKIRTFNFYHIRIALCHWVNSSYCGFQGWTGIFCLMRATCCRYTKPQFFFAGLERFELPSLHP